MAMDEPFQERFAYNRAANHKFIELFDQEPSIPEKAKEIFSHILNVHLIWLNRISPLTNVIIPDIWESLAVKDFAKRNRLCFRQTMMFLERDEKGVQPEMLISYKNSRGKEFKNTVDEIYTHILMHSMYHRGQVARFFREAGIDPPLTDFIMHMRDLRRKM